MKNRFIKELPRALFIGFSIFIVILIIRLLNGEDVSFNHNLKMTFIYTIMYSFSLHLANTFLFVYLDRVFINDRFNKKRIAIGFVASFFLSLFVIFLLRIFINTIIENNSLENFFKQESPGDYVVASVFTFIVLLIIHIIYLYKG